MNDKISVVLATYNGEKYIIKQLDSICNQTKKIDELIISDDNSTDNTVSIINDYIKNNNINYATIYQNKTNTGFVKNFWNSINKTTGDIIFLSDQDDIWDKNKIKIMSDILINNDNIKCLFSELKYIDENDVFINYSHNHGDGFLFSIKKAFLNNIYQLNYKNFIKTGGYQGAGIAFKKEIFNKIKNFNIGNKFAHDVFINYTATLFSGFFILKKQLTFYRLHSHNTLGIPIKHKRDRIEVLKESIKICNQINELNVYLMNDEKNNKICSECLNYIKYLISIYEKRVINLENKCLFNHLLLIFKINYFSSIKTFVGDIIYIIKNKYVR